MGKTETIIQLVLDCTTGDPDWDSKPPEWRSAALSRIVRDIHHTLDNALEFELDEFDAEAWRADLAPLELVVDMACQEMHELHPKSCTCAECNHVKMYYATEPQGDY